MIKKGIKYTEEAFEQPSDLIAEPMYDLFYNNGQNERKEAGTLKVLSLFSGCGGMDIGLEGGFICHHNSVTNPDWVHHQINRNWVLLQRNLFRTVLPVISWRRQGLHGCIICQGIRLPQTSII